MKFNEYHLSGEEDNSTVTLCKFHSRADIAKRYFNCKMELMSVIECDDWRRCVLCVEEQALNGMLEIEEEK